MFEPLLIFQVGFGTSFLFELQEHKSKYIFLLAYASSVCDNWNFKKGTRYVTQFMFHIK